MRSGLFKHETVRVPWTFSLPTSKVETVASISSGDGSGQDGSDVSGTAATTVKAACHGSCDELTTLAFLMLPGLKDDGTVVTAPLSVDHLPQKSRSCKHRSNLM